jgi:hypothetical protein
MENSILHDKRIQWFDDYNMRKLDAINQLVEISPKNIHSNNVGRSFDFKNSPIKKL